MVISVVDRFEIMLYKDFKKDVEINVRSKFSSS